MYIESWLNQQRQSRTADMVVDTTLTQLKERSKVLDKYVPLKTKDGRDWLAYITQQQDTIASIVSTGAEYPAVKGVGFSQFVARTFKAAIRYEWNEDVQWKMKEVQEFARARGITVQNVAIGDGKISVGQDNNLAELIFGTIAKLVRGHINLLDYLAWQVLQTGAMQYQDNRTGLNINLDWKQSGVKAQKNHFPAALTGADKWTEWDTANPIQDLVNMAYVYKLDNGFAPDEIAMSEQLLHQMLNCKSTREAVVSSLTIGSVMTGTVSIDQLNEVLRRRFLPPITLVDDYFQLDPDNVTSETPSRFLDPTRVVFLKKGIAERCLGGTLENNGKAGIYQRTYEKSKEPPLDISATASMMLVTAPTIARLGMSRVVCDQAGLDASLSIADFDLP